MFCPLVRKCLPLPSPPPASMIRSRHRVTGKIHLRASSPCLLPPGGCCLQKPDGGSTCSGKGEIIKLGGTAGTSWLNGGRVEGFSLIPQLGGLVWLLSVTLLDDSNLIWSARLNGCRRKSKLIGNRCAGCRKTSSPVASGRRCFCVPSLAGATCKHPRQTSTRTLFFSPIPHWPRGRGSNRWRTDQCGSSRAAFCLSCVRSTIHHFLGGLTSLLWLWPCVLVETVPSHLKPAQNVNANLKIKK